MAVRFSPLAVLVGLLLSLPCVAYAEERAGTRLVVRAVDGDALELEDGERVRLLGVDTPESVHPRKPVEWLAREAAALTRALAEGQHVRLEGDPGSASRDRYGRTLAYVYLPDGQLLNLEILRRGYGSADTRFPFTRMEEFRAAEREAREAGRGLWAEARPARETERARAERVAPRESDEESSACTPREECCRVCAKGHACGASCISASKTCRQGRGCACDLEEVCR